MDNPVDKLPDIDPVNRQHLERYIRRMRLNGVRETTIKNKCWRIYALLKFIGFRDLATIHPEDIEDFILTRKEKLSPFTVKNDLIEVRQIIKFLFPGKVDEFVTFKMQKPVRQFPVERLIRADNAAEMVKHCTNQRDRAIVSVVWDSGCRINEIMSRNIEHVVFDSYGAVILVDGKTGARRIRLIGSAPDLQAWINQHPDSQNSKAPLFTTFKWYGREGGDRLSAHTVRNLFKTLAKRANIPEDQVYPHALRHGRLTELTAKGLSEAELRIQGGWSSSSSMPQVYVHLSGGDLEKKMLSIAGLVKEEAAKRNPMDPIQCPRCRHLNPAGTRFCGHCSMAVDERAAIEMETLNEMIHADPDYHQALQEISARLMSLEQKIH